MDYVKIKTTIGLGTVVDSLSTLPRSYDETMRAAAYKFQLGTNQVIYAGSLEREGTYGSVAVKSYAGKIALAMKQNDENEIENHAQPSAKHFVYPKYDHDHPGTFRKCGTG